MKLIMRNILLSLGILVLLGGTQLQAQDEKVSLLLGFKMSGTNNINTDDSTMFDLTSNPAFHANLRLHLGNVAIRLGAGFSSFKYAVENGPLISDNYDAERTDMQWLAGLEYHAHVGPLTIYPGFFIPITVTGKDKIVQDNFDNISNGSVRAGLGVVAGANIKLVKILRVGVEFDTTFDNFKANYWNGDGANDLSVASLKQNNVNIRGTVGVAF